MQMKIKNYWLRVFVRGISLWIVLFILNMLIPAWVHGGQIGEGLYTLAIWLVMGIFMTLIVLKVFPEPGKRR